MSEVSEEVATQIAKNCSRQQPHSHLRSLPRGIPASIRTYLIFPETVIGVHFCRCMYGSIFIQFCAVAFKRRIFSAPECVLAVQGRSGSSKVDAFGTNRKRVCDFLLVGNCDYGHNAYLAPFLRFGDLLAKNCLFFLLFSHSAPSLPMFPLEFCGEVNREETTVMGLSSSEDSMIVA